MHTNKHLLLLSLLLLAVTAGAAPIVRVVSTNDPDRAFTTDQVRKLVLSDDAVDVVDHEGSVLLSVPKSDIARVEFTEGIPTAIDPYGDSRSEEHSTFNNTHSTLHTQKVLRSGQLLIIRDGRTYNAQGVEIK